MNYDEQNRDNACDAIRDHATALNLSVVNDSEESRGACVTVDTEGDTTAVVVVGCNQNSKNRCASTSPN